MWLLLYLHEMRITETYFLKVLQSKEQHMYFLKARIVPNKIINWVGWWDPTAAVMQCGCLYSGSYDTTVSVHSLISGSHSATWGYGIRVHCLRQDVTEAEQYKYLVLPLPGLYPAYQNTKHKSSMCWVNHYFFMVNLDTSGEAHITFSSQGWTPDLGITNQSIMFPHTHRLVYGYANDSGYVNQSFPQDCCWNCQGRGTLSGNHEYQKFMYSWSLWWSSSTI